MLDVRWRLFNVRPDPGEPEQGVCELKAAWFRLDRAITVSLVSPLRKAGLLGRRRAIPILMYHDIDDEPEPGRASYYRTRTSRAVFEEHMEFLRERGYESVDLAVAREGLSNSRPGSPKPVVITFDDGYRSFLTGAFPILKSHGFTATVFLPTQFIGDKRASFLGRECLTWGEVRDLRAEGVTFGSHTRRHPRLVDLSWSEVEAELAGSKAEIEEQLGEAVRWFAFPYAFPGGNKAFVERLEILLRAFGYQGCATTEIGCEQIAGTRFFFRRLPNNNDDDRALFRAKVEGAYDWMRLAQQLVKRTKQGLAMGKISLRSGQAGL